MDAAAFEARRLRVAWWAVGVGSGLGLVAAGGVGVAGGDGAAGLAVLLLVWAATATVTGLGVLVVGFVDELRRRPVGRRRVLVALGLLAAGMALMVMGVGAAAGGRP